MDDQAVQVNPQGQALPSTTHAERLERVQETITDLEHLNAGIGQIRERLAIFDQRLEETGLKSVRELWKNAQAELTSFLGQPVQLTPGAKPLILDEARETFVTWAKSFADNAVGPGGDGLHENEERLTAFEDKLNACEPTIASLADQANSLLQRASLKVEILDQQVKAVMKASAHQLQKQSVVDSLRSRLSEVPAQLAALNDERDTLHAQLALLHDRDSVSSELKKKAEAGLSALGAVNPDKLVEKISELEEWIEKYQGYTNFSTFRLEERLHTELLTPLGELRTQFARIKTSYDPMALERSEHERKQREQQRVIDRLETSGKQIKDRYQALVELRRKKLGSEPDERYFGAIAKQVNDAITELGNTENHLLDTLRKLRDEPGANQTNETQLTELTKNITEALASSADLVDPTKLEQLLASQWKAELAPLTAAITDGQTMLKGLKEVKQDYQKRKGFAGTLADEVTASHDQLLQTLTAAESFRANAEAAHEHVSTYREQLQERLVGLTEAIHAAHTLLEPGYLPQKLAAAASEQARAEKERRAKEAEAQRIAQVQQERRFAERLSVLETKRAELSGELTRGLNYLQTLETISAETALKWYERLETALNATIDDAPVRELVMTDHVLTTLKSDIRNLTSDVQKLDLRCKQLEWALSSAGGLSLVLTELNAQMDALPGSQLEERKRTVHQLFGAIGQRDLQQNREAERLTKLETEPRLVSGEEARVWLNTLDTHRFRLGEFNDRLASAKLELQVLQREIASPHFTAGVAHLKETLDHLVLAPLDAALIPSTREQSSNEQQLASSERRVNEAKKLGQNLRASLHQTATIPATREAQQESDESVSIKINPKT